MKRISICFFILFLAGTNIFSQKANTPKPIPPIEFKEGILSYVTDSLGNRIPDFSYAGYKAGEEPIPNVEIKTVIPRIEGDATSIIQSALDYVGSLQPDAHGFRGAVLLQPGEYKVSGSLLIHNSGVVLRGSGTGETGTKLIAAGKDRRTLIRILGEDDKEMKDTIPVKDSYVPVNAMSMNVPANHGLKIGDKVYIHRPSTQEWIKTLETDHFGGGITALGWKPGEHDIYWDRTVTDIKGNNISFDAPITTALDTRYGGGYIISYNWQGRISNIGIENLTCTSEYDEANPKDEAHSWMAVTMENVSDAWVRNMIFKHFAGSAVMVLETAKRVTVENCKSLQPVSEIGGQRRYTFFTMGQQSLFQRLYSEEGYHDFGVGYCAPGPNVFVQCYSELPHSFSGAIGSWASGVLFDIVNVNGNALSYKNRMQEGQGVGWSGANSVFWQCSASLIECFTPPTAQNWAFGSWSEFSGNGYWNGSNNHIQPRSLYYQQLAERLGEEYVDRSNLLPFEGEASSSPKIEVAAKLTKKAYKPALTLSEWIDELHETGDIPIVHNSSLFYKEKQQKILKQIQKSSTVAPLSIYNGWLTRGTTVQTGCSHSIRWWNGSVRPTYLKKNASPHLTRFVPGRTGIGLTDDIDSVARILKENHYVTIDHNYGLWYDRRRDDHQRIRRMDGDVWAPFYEQPFARSGKGTGYDGLSKYDLTKFNDWYWQRLRQFVDVADREGLILFHQNYFQHNIIEAGAHWTDSPWRPVNNINNTGFPEPVRYAGDKRIFLAEQFYDVDHPVRRELHKKYIRQCLDNFRGGNSVIQFISAEYTGPLHFVEFWLDVIAEWKKETGEDQLIALSTTKDVQDAILADPIRSEIVDIIDIRYWFYRQDGTVYEPKGGQNLAPRQHARLTKPGKASFASVYKAVNEYREKYPDKAVIYFSDMYPQNAWASFMAEGSLACLPPINDERFLQAASGMESLPELNSENQYVLGNPEKGYIIYAEEGNINLSIDLKYNYDLYWVDVETGEVSKAKQGVKRNKEINLSHSSQQAIVAWLVRR